MQSELEQLSQDLSKNSVSELVAEVFGHKPQMRVSTARQPTQHTEEHIHKVLKTSKGLIENHRQFIRDNMYAFWPPSTLAYKNSFEDFQSGMKRIKMVRKTQKILNMDISKVLLSFRNQLDELTEEEWTLENVGAKAKELADSVTLYNTEKDLFMEHGAGWKFLRWSLLVGTPGLSVVPVMVLLGQKETLKRLRVARQCARNQEEKMAVEARKAAQLQKRSRLHSKVMGYSTGKGQDSPDDQVSEPRNVKVRISKEEPTETESKAKGFLRPMHHESHLPEKGPFVSKPQPRFEPVQRPEDRPPKQFISFEEFSTGSRHILREEYSDPAYSPPTKRATKRANRKPVRRSEPADEINPFAPGGSFFAPDPETGSRSSQPESTRPQSRADHPPDSASHTLQTAHTKTQPGPLQGMSDSQRQLHFKHLMLQKAYERKRQASSAPRLKIEESGPRKQPGAAADDAPGPVGAFFAGPVVNHPLRVKANGKPAGDVEGGSLSQGGADKGHGAEVAELEQIVKESWVERRRSKGAKNTEDWGR